MHLFTSLWYKSAPNFSIDNQLDISRPSRYQGKSQLRVKLRLFLQQMGYGDSSSLFLFENGCSVECLQITLLDQCGKTKLCTAIFLFFAYLQRPQNVFGHLSYKCMNHCSISIWTISGCLTLVDHVHS